MGLCPSDVEILGEVEDMPTSSQFLISTYVGTIPYPYDYKPSRSEVAAVLEVPISALTDHASVRDEMRLIDGELTNTPAYAYKGHLIFGATARVLRRFLELLNTVPDEEAMWRQKQPRH